MFCYLGFFAQNVPFIEKIGRAFFWDQSGLAQTPPTSFLLFKNIVFIIFGKWITLFLFLDVYPSQFGKFPLKIWWRIFSSSKLTTFDPIFQLNHSALIDWLNTQKVGWSIEYKDGTTIRYCISACHIVGLWFGLKSRNRRRPKRLKALKCIQLCKTISTACSTCLDSRT